MFGCPAVPCVTAWPPTGWHPFPADLYFLPLEGSVVLKPNAGKLTLCGTLRVWTWYGPGVPRGTNPCHRVTTRPPNPPFYLP